jgi:hypothetical protein
MLAVTVLLSTATSASAGKPTSPKPPSPRIEFSVSGAVFTLPDYTADLDDSDGFVSDQCREMGNDDQMVVQRKTTLQLSALGLGEVRSVSVLNFDAIAAGPDDVVKFSLWLSKNCQLVVVGVIESGQWPLQGGFPGPDLVVLIPAGAPWTFNKFGGGQVECSGNPVLAEDAFITIRRNDGRSGDVCDCPFDYADDDGNMIADECE